MIPVALIFSCVAVGTLYTVMSWALVSAYGTNTDWTKIANTGSTAVINGKTVPADYNNFVLGPVSAAAGEFWRDALSYLIITGSLACAAALTNAGLRVHVRDGPRGSAAALPRQDASGAQVAVHRSADVGRRGRRAVPGLPVHEPHGAGRLLLVLAAGRDLDRAGAGADGAVGVRVLPARASRRAVVEDDRVRMARLRRPGRRARALLPLRDVRGSRQRAVRQGALHRRLRHVLGASLVARHHRRHRAGGVVGVRVFDSRTRTPRSTPSWAASSTSPSSTTEFRGGAASGGAPTARAGAPCGV